MRVLFLLITLFVATPVLADDIFSNILISDEIKQKEAQKKLLEEQKKAEKAAIEDAMNLSKRRFDRLKLKDEGLTNIVREKKTKKEKDQIKTSAPFGLTWGASTTEVEDSGVVLTRHVQKDYVNSFVATNLPKPINDINDVIVAFGEANSLWRILAYGKEFDDNASASMVVDEYKKYYELLEKKYGHAQEFYNGAKKTKTVNNKKIEVEEEIGNNNFLEQLMSGEALLYATFYNKEVGVAISVNVNAEGKTFIAIDYKNIKLFDDKEKQTLDAL